MIEQIESNSNFYTQALQLLKDNKLPTEDINEQTTLFGYILNDQVLGTVGIESYADKALLRSLAVASTERSAGIGNALVNFIEDHAKEKGLKEIVLLTTTAAAYFDKRSYTSIERTNIPEAIKQSAEFRSTCPASATTMLKTL